MDASSNLHKTTHATALIWLGVTVFGSGGGEGRSARCPPALLSRQACCPDPLGLGLGSVAVRFKVKVGAWGTMEQTWRTMVQTYEEQCMFGLFRLAFAQWQG